MTVNTLKVISLAVLLGGDLCIAARAGSNEVLPLFQPLQPPRAIQVIACSGASLQAPPCSRSALVHCLEDGIEWASVGVWLTRDGEHLLSPTNRLPGVAVRQGLISDCSLEELLKADIGSGFGSRFAGERPITLDHALSLCKNRMNLLLDCKAVGPEKLLQYISRSGMNRQVLLLVDAEHLPRFAGKGVALAQRWSPSMHLGSLRAVGVYAIFVSSQDFRADLCKQLQAAGFQVLVNISGDSIPRGTLSELVALGARWFITECPEEAIAYGFQKNGGSRLLQFSLHRGASRYAPENTVPAFDKALRLGADFIEFDVRSCEEGAYFLLHDSRLDRTTDGSGPLKQTSEAAVRRLSAGIKFGNRYASVRVPSLDDFLKQFGTGAQLYLDAKDIEPAPLVAVLRSQGLERRTVVYQQPDYLLRLKQLAPEIRRLAPLRDERALEAVTTPLEPYAVDIDWSILSPELIRRCHAKGLKVFSDGLGEHETVESYSRAIQWGIDVIQTDHPLRLFRALETLEHSLGSR